jgi:hypothetical protein
MLDLFFECPEKNFSSTLLGKNRAPKKNFAPGPRISLIGPEETVYKKLPLKFPRAENRALYKDILIS